MEEETIKSDLSENMDEITKNTSENEYTGEDGKFKHGNPGKPKGATHRFSITNVMNTVLHGNDKEVEKIIRALIDKHPDLVWKMLDGAPKTAIEHSGDLTIKITKYGNEPTE